MPQYMLSVIRPVGYDHSTSLSDQARREIDALNDEMVLAGIRVFVGGLRPPSSAQCVPYHANGGTAIDERSGLMGSDYLDGFWVLECSTQEEALGWATKASSACRARIEIRPFH